MENNINSTTEQQYLELAEDCKNRIEEKNKYIDYLKSKFLEIDDDIRHNEYKLKQIEFLIEYEKKKNKTKKSNQFYDTLLESIKYMLEYVNIARERCQDEDEEEQIFLVLNDLTNSIDSVD